MKRFFIAALLLALAGASIFQLLRQRSAAPAVRSSSIVLITIDTLRADRIGRGLTPALDELAKSGRRFDNARAAVPLTLPSHVTIMTGTLPTVHGVHDNGVVFDGARPTLAGVLRQAGYRTGAFVGAYVLDRRFGLAEGFETYDDRVPRDPEAAARLEAERRGQEVVDAAIAWLQGVTGPFFLWVHLYDPHAPYDPPESFKSGSAGSPYDGEVAYADAQVGRLLKALGDRSLLDDTLVAAAGDHGEGLGEHRELTHGMLAYDTTLRVPLIVAGRGVPQGVVTAPVSLADLVPSLVARLGRGGLSPGAGGVDLLAEPTVDRDIYAETRYPRAAGWHPLSVLAGERWKLVLSS
ncbi:MAG TPA: sulfatase, partial [Vicinamibacterales bacterium]|nr:sulfatase [Vicinamibacterales bacterium]